MLKQKLTVLAAAAVSALVISGCSVSSATYKETHGFFQKRAPLPAGRGARVEIYIICTD